jgi:sarcosine oxidase subunit gamma
VLSESGADGHAARLRERLGALASVCDQSGGYQILQLSGPDARTLLQRGAAIDLHPSAFASGSVATTVIAHIGVILRQLDAAPTYEVALFRSYAASFRHWLDAAVCAL